MSTLGRTRVGGRSAVTGQRRERRGRRFTASLAAVALLLTGTAAVSPVATAAPPTLVQSFDDVGVTAPTTTAPSGSGGFDGIGDTFSSSSLAEDGVVPGQPILHDGQTLTWPDVAPGAPDNVLADGQTIAVSGTGSVLGVVASSAYGSASGTWTVNYTDGSSSSTTVTVADWIDDTPAAGTDQFASAAGWNGGGTVPINLSYVALPLTAGETVASVTLPSIGGTTGANVESLHVFDLQVGSPGASATGAPGDASYYDQGRKDCAGTAADTLSKTWYTVADGTLSDVYDPTIDNTDVKSLDPIVTGPGFTALQPRDMTYTVSELGSTGMACRVVALDSAQHFAVVTDFVTDPTTDAVVMQESLVTLPGAPSGLAVYLRFNPLLNGHGGGGTDNAGGESATIVPTGRGEIPLSYSTNSLTEATNRTYATPIYAALAADTPFRAVETGYEGTASDGLTELDNSGSLTSSAPDANNGNVVQTVELSLSPAGSPSRSGRSDPRGRRSAPPAGRGSLGAYSAGVNSGSSALACSSDTVTSARRGQAGRASADPRRRPTANVQQVLPAGIASSVAAAAHVPVNPADVASATVALGFGESESSALQTALGSSSTSFVWTYAAFQRQWLSYDAALCAPPASLPGASPVVAAKAENAYWLSANVIKASEDKTFLGATAASLASPWGQSVPAGQTASDGLAPYFGSYREVFPRDAYETFTGFLTDGDLGTARQIVYYLFDDMQLPSGAFPRNGLTNGQAAPDTGGLQLDEVADPILMAWQAGLGSDRTLYLDHVKPAADFLVANGPSDGVERWEEQTGLSPSTMADEVAGLVAAASIAQEQGDPASAQLFGATADNFRRLILTTTVTTNGPLSSSPYFIRVDKTGDPDQAYDYTLGNGDPTSFDQRTVIDQGFLELTRLGELSLADPANAALVSNSLAVAASTIDVSTPSGTGIMRYNGDGYGDCVENTPAGDQCSPTGAPWAPTDTGTGHPWPVLSGENGEYQISAGDSAAAVSDLSFMLNSASGVGLVPEQVWDSANVPASPYGSDPTTASIGFVDGQADGSAAPLTWAQSQELRLIRDMGAGRTLEQPAVVADRYAHPPAAAPLAVTAPVAVSGGNVPTNLVRPSTTVDAATTTVTGITTPGASVQVVVSGTAQGASIPTTTITAATVSSSGTFSVAVSLEPGTNSLEVTTTSGGSARPATNEALFAVDDLYVPGTVVLQAAPAPGGGNGPGTYAYPTATNSDGSPVFVPDSFRLSGLTVINSGSTVSFQVRIANLQSTFGSLLGTQLIDLYIHAPSGSVPAGEMSSTGAAGAWNYTIAPADAWNQLIEVDGFGTDDWVTPSSTTAGEAGSSSLGTPQMSVGQLPAGSNGETPGLVTITVPTSVLGTPGPGWTFTVTLTGQDGYGNDDARPFDATPQAYNFGVCSEAVASEASPPAVCAVNPNNVPIVMDTIPPTSVDVQTELNPTLNPQGVSLQGVTIGS